MNKANERTFLSWLRLSVILAVVGAGTFPIEIRSNRLAVVVNFSLNPGSPSEISLKYHVPVAVLFSIHKDELN